MCIHACIAIALSLKWPRLRSEMKNLMKKPDGGISVSLPDDSDVFLWKANIVAPHGSIYEGTNQDNTEIRRYIPSYIVIYSPL